MPSPLAHSAAAVLASWLLRHVPSSLLPPGGVCASCSLCLKPLSSTTAGNKWHSALSPKPGSAVPLESRHSRDRPRWRWGHRHTQHMGACRRRPRGPEIHTEADTQTAAHTPRGRSGRRKRHRATCLLLGAATAGKTCAGTLRDSVRHTHPSVHTHTHTSLRRPEQPHAKCPGTGTAGSQLWREGVPENNASPPPPPARHKEPLSA